MDSCLYTPFTTGQVPLHVTIYLYLLCRINKSANSCDLSPDHVMNSPGGIYTLGPSLVLSLHHSATPTPPFTLSSSSSIPAFIMSAFFDGNMAPPSSNEEMQANWSQYTDWQCYMLTRDIEAAEMTRQLNKQCKLLDKVLSNLLELQLDFKAHKHRSACQSCGRGGIQSPAPVGRSYGGRKLLRRPRRPSPPSSTDSTPPLLSQSTGGSQDPPSPSPFRDPSQDEVSLEFSPFGFIYCINGMLICFRSLSLMPVMRDEVPREEALLWDQLSPP